MYNEYFKKIEGIISPSIIDYDGKDIVRKSRPSTSNKNDESSSILKPQLKHNKISYNTEQIEKVEIPVSFDTQTNFTMREKSVQKSINVINDTDTLKQIIKAEKNKNMNYRFEIQELKKHIDILSEKTRVQEETIDKLERIRESDKKYVNKMEDMIKRQSEKAGKAPNHYFSADNTAVNKSEKDLSKIKTVKISNSNYLIDKKDDIFLFGNGHYSINISDKEQVKSTLLSLGQQNVFFNNFTETIFSLSKKKEELNETIISNWRKIGNFFQSIEHPNDFSLHNLRDVIDDFNIVTKAIMEVMTTKQSEFSFIINSRNEQFNFINKELKELRSEISQLKYDRSIDLKVISELECTKELLEARIEEMETLNRDHQKKLYIVESLGLKGKKSTSLSKTGRGFYGQTNIKTEVSEKENHVKSKKLSLNTAESRKLKEEQAKKKALEKSIGKIEKCLDLNDKNNFNFCDKLQTQLHFN